MPARAASHWPTSPATKRSAPRRAASSRMLFSTPTKRGTGWATCELYPADEVRANIRRDIALAVKSADHADAWRLPPPIEVGVEWAWSGAADNLAKVPG